VEDRENEIFSPQSQVLKFLSYLSFILSFGISLIQSPRELRYNEFSNNYYLGRVPEQLSRNRAFTQKEEVLSQWNRN